MQSGVDLENSYIVMIAGLSFHNEHKATVHEYTIKFQNHPGLSSLL